MKQQYPLTSVIIPAYNEENNITKVITDVLKLTKKFPLEIIVVDDGSKDKTVSVAKKAGAHKVITYKKNKGKGGAFRVGIDAAKGEYIVQIDADHQFQPNEIPLFIQALHEGNDIVCGTRFDKGKVEKGSVSKTNLFGNWLMSNVTTFFSGIKVTDIMAGFKGFTQNAAKKLDLVTQHFGYEAEIIVKSGKLGLKVKELPITYTKRAFGSSSVHAIKDGIRVSYTIAKMYLTFPGPPPGHGIVGKRILTFLIPLWFIIVLPLFSLLTNQQNGDYTLFEAHYIISLLLFFTTYQLTGSRLSSLIASSFFAITPFAYPNYSPFFFSLFFSSLTWIFFSIFTALFLQEKKMGFLKKTIGAGLFFNLCLFFLQDKTFLLIHWFSLELSLFSLFLVYYFWKIEKKVARSMLLASIFIFIGVIFQGALLTLTGMAILLGTLISSFFLETVSFRKDISPLFSFHRIIRTLLLSFLILCIFTLPLLKLL